MSPGAATGSSWWTPQDRRLALDNVESLTDFTWRVRQALNAQGFPEVDHVELFGPSPNAGADCRNFVLCPGKAYDRSPCGTGTSAKLACLAADGTLAEGESWIQESVIGSSFSASFRWLDRSTGKIAPTHQRPGSCDRGEHAAARRVRSILLGNPMNEPLLRTMSGQITTRIRDKILAGEYSPGSPLLQDSIAAEFGVSKIPVREALVRLRAEGLIDIEAHRGFRVRPLLAAEVDEVFRLRLALEPAAVSDGARVAKAKDHIAAREALRSLNDALAAKTMSDIGNLNSAFHLALIVPHQQPVTCEVLSRLHTLSQRYVRMHLLPVGRVRRATREHNALYEAWAEGDARQARQLTDAAHRRNPRRTGAVPRARLTARQRTRAGSPATRFSRICMGPSSH